MESHLLDGLEGLYVRIAGVLLVGELARRLHEVLRQLFACGRGVLQRLVQLAFFQGQDLFRLRFRGSQRRLRTARVANISTFIFHISDKSSIPTTVLQISS